MNTGSKTGENVDAGSEKKEGHPAGKDSGAALVFGAKYAIMTTDANHRVFSRRGDRGERGGNAARDR